MKNRPLVSIEFSSYGVVQIELYPEHAKETTNNFITLINSGYYDNMAICRIVNNRLIQSGNPSMNPEERTDDTPGYILDGEFNREGFSNPLSFKRGTVGMAMAAYHYTPYATAGSFFIMTKDEETLDKVVPAFGRVISGMDVVDEINNLKTHSEYGYYAPFEVIKIASIKVETYGIEYSEPKKIDVNVLNEQV